MPAYLVDTNVVSDPMQLRPEERVQAFMRSVPPSDLFLSAFSLGEIWMGICRLPHGRRRVNFEKWVERDVIPRYADRILPFDAAVARTWGELDASLRAKGRPKPPPDSFIAATALHYDLTLLTRNVSDFLDTGVTILNPWTDPPPLPYIDPATRT